MDFLPLLQRYKEVRSRTQRLCVPLTIEDHLPQPIPEVSPPKWHLAHVTWFFETLVLKPQSSGYRLFDPHFAYLFNSYYESLGERWLRSQRGHLSRPTVAQVYAYRAHVDAAMEDLIERVQEQDRTDENQAMLDLIELGIQHEQQHQELLLTDLKYILFVNPSAPIYDSQRSGLVDVAHEHKALSEVNPFKSEWVRWPGGLAQVGHAGASFSFDNERPAHLSHVPGTEIQTRLVSNREYLSFIEDGGYQRFAFWHAQGWDWVQQQRIHAPLYWRRVDQTWEHFTLQGLQPLDADAPVSHISYYEAFAYCQWANGRLPTEFEWESLCNRFTHGQRWEWTSSAYLPYPGFKTDPGAVGEYNGKFMVGQQVLRGGSFATPPGHTRSTYRNFFQPELRWQYTGIRLAKDSPSP